MRRSPPKRTLYDLPRPVLPAPNGSKSPAPRVVVECWILMVGTMDRVRLDRFTRETWRKFDAADLGPLRDAILRRRRILALQAWP